MFSHRSSLMRSNDFGVETTQKVSNSGKSKTQQSSNYGAGKRYSRPTKEPKPRQFHHDSLLTRDSLTNEPEPTLIRQQMRNLLKTVRSMRQGDFTVRLEIDDSYGILSE